MGNRGGFECGREMVEIDAEEEPLEKDKMCKYQVDCQLRGLVCSTYRNPQNWKGDQSQGQEGKSDGDRWVFGVFLEDVVDFRQLAVSRHLDRRDRFVGVPVDRELKRKLIVGLRTTKGSNEESSINRLGERKELNGEVLLRLSRARVR